MLLEYRRVKDNSFDINKLNSIPPPQIYTSADSTANSSPANQYNLQYLAESSALAKLEDRHLDNKLKEQELIEARNNNELRKEIAKRLWHLTVGWLFFVAVVVFFGGIDHECLSGFFYLEYETSVLIALITTSTATVLGLFIVLLKYLYPSKSSKSPLDVSNPGKME